VLSLEKRPYAILPVERSLYTNDPYFLSVHTLVDYLNAFKYYDISGLNIIPFVIGSSEEQLRLCCTVLRNWGFKNVAWSISGLNKAHYPDRIRKTYWLISRFFDQIAMVNFLSFRGCYQKSVFLSPDWYLIPHEFGRRIAEKRSHQARCACNFCKGRLERMVNKEELALCSLSGLFSFFDRYTQTTLEESLFHQKAL
jgi:hypothetical protein